MSVPFLDLGRLHASIRPELDEVFDRTLRDSSFVGGAAVADFEAAFAGAHGVAAGAGCGSGTDALALALRSLGVGPGDEVIVPAMTFVATAEAVVHAGASPVVADVDERTLLLSADTVDAVRTPSTRAVMPVHLYGHHVAPALLQGWRDDGLLVVEDAAQAHLASADGIGVGTIGHAACFSFYPGKNLGALGDGGMVISDDADVVARAARLRDHGRATKYGHDVVGWCSRLDGLQAGVLSVKLRHLATWTEARRTLARRYRDRLADHGLVPWAEGAVHHLLVVRVPERAGVQAALRDQGIGTGIHYPMAMSTQPWLAASGAAPAPVAERAADEVLSLPMDPLMTEAEVDVVCDAVLSALEAVA